MDLALHDLAVLERPGAESDYPPEVVAAAHRRRPATPPERLDAVERAVVAGLPGGSPPRSRAEVVALIDAFAGMTHADMAGALAAFLSEVVPVAEEVGVSLGIHPDDPPRALFGIPRVASTADDARALLAAVESPASGLTFCVGSYGARADNDVAVTAREMAPRINFAHLRNVRIEPDTSFHESDHLDGATDMVAVVGALLAEEGRAGRVIPLRPDHGHLLATDAERPSNPGYSYIGRLRGLAELRGVVRALERAA